MRALIIGISTFILLSAVPALAQDDDENAAAASEPGDAVATDEIEPAVDTSRAEEIDELEPGVPSQMLTAENRRGTEGQAVMDELDLGTSEITGNQELPKVLYIVPWRKSDPGDLMGRPANTLLDDVLAPVDRSEFVREVDYYQDLFDEKEAQ